MLTMELNDLCIYTKVIQTGSFTKAAEALNSHKAVLSRSLSQLEAKLGVRLLERSTRSLRPTEIGQTIYERALVILAAVEDVEQLAQQVWQEPKGLLRITCGVEFGMLVVNDWINRYLKAYPQMNVEADFTHRLVDVVQENFDLAIRVGLIQEEHLITRKLGEIHYGLFASPHYLTIHGQPIHPSQLNQYSLLEFTAFQLNSEWLFNKGNETLTIALKARLKINNHFALKEAALQHLGIVRLPYLLAQPLLDTHTLQVILPEWQIPSTPVHAILPSNRWLTPKVKSFLACSPLR